MGLPVQIKKMIKKNLRPKSDERLSKRLGSIIFSYSFQTSWTQCSTVEANIAVSCVPNQEQRWALQIKPTSWCFGRSSCPKLNSLSLYRSNIWKQKRQGKLFLHLQKPDFFTVKSLQLLTSLVIINNILPAMEICTAEFHLLADQQAPQVA